MKQRLLLALLVLFASVGMVKAQDTWNGTVTLTIPKGSTSFTVVVDNAQGITTSNTGGASISSSGNTYTIKSGDNDGTVSITRGVYKSLTINKGANKIEFENAAFNNLEKLLIKQGDITWITIYAYQMKALTSFICETNKLSAVPGNDFPKKDEPGFVYDVKSQKPELTLEESTNWKPANEALTPTLDMLLGTNHGYGTATFKLTNWKHTTESGWANTPHNSGANRYYFYIGGETYKEGDEYVHGEYTCTIEFTNDLYKGVKIEGAKVKVLPAKYVMAKPVVQPAQSGTIGVYEDGKAILTNETNEVTKMDKDKFWELKPIAKDGYGTPDFSLSTGLEIKQQNGSYFARINGKAQPKLIVKFTAEGQTITINDTQNGSISVSDGGKGINSGDKVATDRTIKIKPSPAEGYELDKLMVNGENQIANTEGEYTYKVTADKKEIIISATFKLKTSANLTLKWNGSFSNITINGVGQTSTEDTETSFYYVNNTIQFGTTPTIKITTKKDVFISSIIVGNETITPTVIEEQKGENGTTYLISTFKMPNTAVTMVINTIQKNEAKIIVDSQKNGTYLGTFIYDGTKKIIPYTTDPNGLSGVVVKYKAKDDADALYQTDGFSEAGEYMAKFYRPADNTYAEITKVYNKDNDANDVISFKIESATPIITTLPRVSIEQKTGKYIITPGIAQYGSQKTINKDYCVWEVVNSAGKVIEKTEQTADNDGKFKYESVSVRLHIKKDAKLEWDEDDNKDTNFKKESTVTVKATGQLKDDLEMVKVEVLTAKMPEGTKLTMKNGNEILKNNPASVMSGTTITFDIDYGRYESTNLEIYSVDRQGNKIGESPTAIGSTGQIVTEDMIFVLIPKTQINDLIELSLISAKDEGVNDHKYEAGKIQKFDVAKIQVKNKATGSKIENISWTDAIITYKDAAGNATTEPINAGLYTVTIKRPADNTYKEFTATGTMLVQQAEPTILKWPNSKDTDPALIGRGQALSTAVLTGGEANVKGTFEWISPNTIVNADGSYDVKFVSQDPNYKDISSSADKVKAHVKITNEAILSLAKDDTYTITAKGSDGKSYASGATVPVGTTLTFTVTPAATYKLKTLIVNGKEITGNTYKTTAGPISVKAEMIQEFTVTVTKPTRGIVVTLPSGNIVKKGESYSFTVAALAADMSRIVVKDGTTTVAGSNGRYTISNISENKAITITLDNPTAITVVADTTLSPGKKPMGTVTFTGLTDGKCYYNDRITVKATPVSGVRFAGWTGTTETASSFTFTATAASYKFKALYSGSPVGVETIEGVKIYGSKGAIVVNCDSDAIVTIISMNGQSSKHEISGDARIPANAGIYGVVLQKGSETIQTKVMVR